MDAINKKALVQGSGAIMPPSQNPDKHICRQVKCIRAKRVLAVLVTAIEKTIISPEYSDLLKINNDKNGPYKGPTFFKELGLAKQALGTFYSEEYIDAPKATEVKDEKDTIT